MITSISITGKVVNKLRHHLNVLVPSGSFKRATALLAGGSALAQLIAFIAAPIATRLYGPAEYGVAAVFNSLLGVIAAFVLLRYELAIPIAEDDREALDLLAVCMSFLLLFTLATVGLVWYLGDFIARMVHSASLRNWLWLLPIGVFLAGAYQALSYWILRRRRYEALARTKLSQSIMGTGSVVGLGIVHGGPLGLIVSTIVSQGAGILLLKRDALTVLKSLGHRLRIKGLALSASKYRHFPLYALGASLASTAAAMMPPLLLTRLYSEEITGWFSLALKIMNMPLSLIGIAVSQVFIGEAAKTLKGDEKELSELFGKTTKHMFLFGLLILAAGGASPFLFASLFGEKWSMAGIYASCLSLFCATQFVVSPMSAITVVKKRMGVQFALDIFRAALVFLSFWVPAFLNKPGLVAVICYSFSMSGAYLLYYFCYRKISLDPSGVDRSASASEISH